MTYSPPVPHARLHQYGPWTLVGVAAAALIVYEARKHHLFSSYEVLFFVVLFPTIILHEVSHGLVAYWCGDDTAKNAKRLSLNPLRHIDIFGTILLPILLIVTTGSAFGWAKPVPVSINKLRHPRNQAVLVGLAGPAVNIAIALIAGFALNIATHQAFALHYLLQHGFIPNFSSVGYELLFLLGITNVYIAVFNLIPIPPLDGSAIVERLLPTSALPQYYRMRTYFMVLVLFVVLAEPNVLDTLFLHAADLWSNIVF